MEMEMRRARASCPKKGRQQTVETAWAKCKLSINESRQKTERERRGREEGEGRFCINASRLGVVCMAHQLQFHFRWLAFYLRHACPSPINIILYAIYIYIYIVYKVYIYVYSCNSFLLDFYFVFVAIRNLDILLFL